MGKAKKAPYETFKRDGVEYAILQETFGAKKVRHAFTEDGEPYDETTPMNRLCSAGQMLRTGKYIAVISKDEVK